DCDEVDFYLSQDGYITDEKPVRNGEVNYDHVAHELHTLLLSHGLNQSRTTIHVDGDPSLEKEQEYMRRWDGERKKLEALTKEVDRFVEKKKGSPVDIFRRCRRAFRIPRPVLAAICAALYKLGDLSTSVPTRQTPASPQSAIDVPTR
ncbi:hypothetical protein BGZ65_000849, partial [Modicella reniformis]